MHYLITGGCGFLGSNVAAELLAAGHRVTLFDNLSKPRTEDNLTWLRTQGAPLFIEGDIRHAQTVRDAVRESQPDIIFHFAGQVAMTTSLKDPRLDFEINALGSLNLLEAVRTERAQAGILYSSTNKVYGDLTQLRYEETPSRYVATDYPRGLPETLPLNFHSPYGCSKGAADQYMLDYSRMYGLRTAVFRHSSMYGARQFSTIDQGWIGWFCQQIQAQQDSTHETFTISGNGKQVRDLLHADDIVSLYINAAQELPRISGQAFNIGGGMENSLSVLELLDFLAAETGVAPRSRHIPPRESDQRVFIADLTKIQTMLEWKPKVNWQQGVRGMLSWVGKQNAHG